MSEQEGPHITISASCHGCVYCESERFEEQGDAGFDRYCHHPDVADGPGRRYIGSYTAKTPTWCPLLFSNINTAIGKKLSELVAQSVVKTE